MLNIYTMLLALLMAELLPYVVVHACGADILLTNGLSFVNAYMYTRPLAVCCVYWCHVHVYTRRWVLPLLLCAGHATLTSAHTYLLYFKCM